MELTILGAGTAMPNPGGASSGYLLTEGDTQLLVDCGHGVPSILQTVTGVRDLSAIIISHMHADHIFGLVPLGYGYLFGSIPPIPLYLPPGGEEVLHRLEWAVNLGEGFFGMNFRPSTYDPAQPLQIGPLHFRFTHTRHFVPGWAMRIHGEDTPERALLYSSDTGWSEDVIRLGREASLALVEASLPEYRNEQDREGHLTPQLAGKLAREAGADRLIITHYWHGNAEVTRETASAAFGKRVELAREGECFVI